MIVEKLYSKNSMYFSVFLEILLNFDNCYFLLRFKQIYFKQNNLFVSNKSLYIYRILFVKSWFISLSFHGNWAIKNELY